MADSNKSERYLKGWARLQQVHGEVGEGVLEELAETAPALRDFIIEFPYGDIYARPGLDLRSRQIATISALTALGNARKELKVHILAGLRVGLSREEIIEIIMQMSVYAGFPAALEGIEAAREAFSKADAAQNAASTSKDQTTDETG